jgi:hypothetical protein
MPGFDGTGPFGQGPMTGRGFGRCRSEAGIAAGSPAYPTLKQVQESAQAQMERPLVYGRGRGGIPFGCGRGFGFGGGRRRC